MINVTDVNDNRPIFNIPPGGYQASISEDAFIGDPVITVEATDLDSSNQFITYSIDTNVTGVSVPFAILDPTVSYFTIMTWGWYRESILRRKDHFKLSSIS